MAVSLSGAARETLGLPNAAAPPKKPERVFDPKAHYGFVGGVDGVRYVQGDAYFNPRGDFVRLAPKEAHLKPLTAQQEADRQKRMSKDRKLFGKRLVDHMPSVPQSLVDAQRENARAEAAERQAE